MPTFSFSQQNPGCLYFGDEKICEAAVLNEMDVITDDSFSDEILPRRTLSEEFTATVDFVIPIKKRKVVIRNYRKYLGIDILMMLFPKKKNRRLKRLKRRKMKKVRG